MDEKDKAEVPEKKQQPRRYNLYDRLKINIPLKVMDAVIWILVALLLLALFIGILGQ